MTYKDSILHYLKIIYPQAVTNSDLCHELELGVHQNAFYVTRDLREAGVIEGFRQGREWYFRALDDDLTTIPLEVIPQSKAAKQEVVEDETEEMTHSRFEFFALLQFSRQFNTVLSSGKVDPVNKIWDMVSEDGKIVGDAKYYSLVRGVALPPAKFATIAEHVWLLENCPAEMKFLVFGNQIEVPQLWLEKYGNLVTDVQFYFMSNVGEIQRLR